jgi:hypothetical protein
MTFALLASRKGYLKVMGSLIQAALTRGHSVVLLSDPDERKPGEATTPEDFGHWPRARLVAHRRGEPLLAALQREGADALVGPSLHFVLVRTGLAPDIQEIRKAGVRLYSVDYAFETLTSDPDGYRVIDVTFYSSEYQRLLHWTVLEAEFARLPRDVDRKARSAVCGSTMLDQLARVDRPTVKKALGLDPGRPVVLLMSLKMAVPEPWRRYVWGGGPAVVRALRATARGHARLVPEIWRGNGYRALVDAMRRFCGRAGAALVVKSREKNRDPVFLRRGADVFVERDTDVFPYTSMQLMAVADLCVHFQSGAALEAAFCGVPSLSVQVPQTHLEMYPGFRESFGGDPGSLQNFPGIVWSAPSDRAAQMLERRDLADFAVDAEVRRAYIEKYMGFDDARSSERVLDVIERDAALRHSA